ncbi:MAG TPA: hypothetical protein VMA34_05805 [Terracidiphilus sp.]|nr:hypothetical protein [Terracidiphilus sp.]
MKWTVFSLAGFLLVSPLALAQSSQQPQPLNANVSDFGTSYIFSPPPICPGCLETELGFLGISAGRQVGTAITAAPFRSHTDFTALFNLIDSEKLGNDRFTQFGNRIDVVIRQQVYSKGTFEFTAAPRGTVFLHGTDGGRIGGTAALQYGRGKYLGALNLNFTRALSNPSSGARNDYLTCFDLYRTLGERGASWFAGFQQETSTGNDTTIGVEQGLVLPFRNGQVELAAEELTLNTSTVIQLQARAIVNWGHVFHR